MLGEKEVLVVGDFAENFTFVMQDEVQSYHWKNVQATIHPCLLLVGERSVKACVMCFCICLTHETITVRLFQQHLLFLEEIFG